MTKRKDPKDFLPQGPPTKWKPELNQSLVEHFMGEHTREVEVEKIGKNGQSFTTYEERANPIPTFQGWCAKNDLDADLISEWVKAEDCEKRRPGLRGSYKRAKQLQHDWVIANAITGRFNPAFSIFFAKNNMGMRDKTETELTVQASDDLDSLDDQKEEVAKRAKHYLFPKKK